MVVACWAEIIAIGASTGGPQTLRRILSGLPAGFAVPIVVVQHIVPGFAAGMAEWLDRACQVPVRVAGEGVALNRPGIHLAPTGKNVVVRGRRIRLRTDSSQRSHPPSVNALFRSVAREYGPSAVGVLLTGMGDDGAEGLKELRQAGALTVVQNKSSSVIFGMPAAALALGAADYILAPWAISQLLTDLQSARRAG